MLESPEAQTDQKKDANNKGSDGFITQLTNKIVDNLQFTMKNIHIRYEDKISDPGHPFAAGITLKELSALSTDEEWVPKFISEPTNTINKVKPLHGIDFAGCSYSMIACHIGVSVCVLEHGCSLSYRHAS